MAKATKKRTVKYSIVLNVWNLLQVHQTLMTGKALSIISEEIDLKMFRYPLGVVGEI